MKSFKPNLEYIFIMCQIIGLDPISSKGFGLTVLSSDILEPNPPASMTTFINSLISLTSKLKLY